MSKFGPEFGKRYTKAMFYEMTLADKSTVLYTLKDSDHQGYPSLRRLYLECDDPTEYEFITKYLESQAHFEDLCRCEWFKPHISRWRKESELKLKSEALARIRQAAKAGGKEVLALNRYLCEKGWEPKEGQTRKGRPTKAQILQQANDIATANASVSDDFERLMN